MPKSSKTVVLSKAREPVLVKLPSFPDAEVYMLPYLTVEEQRSILEKFPNLKSSALADQQDAGLELACKAIASWNFAEEVDGKQTLLEVSRKSLSLFPSTDVNLLCAFVSGRATRAEDGTLTLLTDEEKKA